MPRASTTADVEPHGPDCEQEDDTIQHNNQDLHVHEESSHDAESNPCFDEISEDNPEDELERTKRGRFVSSKRNHVVDPPTEPGLLEAGKDDYQTPDRWTKLVSSWNPSNIKQEKKGTGNNEDRPRDGKTSSTSTYNRIEPTERTTTSRVI